MEKTTYHCYNCRTSRTPQEFKTNSAETIRPVCPKCGRSDNYSKFTRVGSGKQSVHVHPNVRFSQDNGGNYCIRVADTELAFNLNRLGKSQMREVVNGLANILSGVACYMDRDED